MAARWAAERWHRRSTRRPAQVGEALLIGPGQMPVFPICRRQDVNAVATYVEYLQTAPDPGGFSIGGIGPVPEGFVAWVLGWGC